VSGYEVANPIRENEIEDSPSDSVTPNNRNTLKSQNLHSKGSNLNDYSEDKQE
jgi:hypothetical protein